MTDNIVPMNIDLCGCKHKCSNSTHFSIYGGIDVNDVTSVNHFSKIEYYDYPTSLDKYYCYKIKQINRNI